MPTDLSNSKDNSQDCPPPAHLIQFAADDPTLSTNRRQLVAEHISVCEECHAKVSSLKRAYRKVSGKATEKTFPEYFVSRLKMELAARGRRTLPSTRPPMGLLAALTAAACVLVAIVLGAGYRQHVKVVDRLENLESLLEAERRANLEVQLAAVQRDLGNQTASVQQEVKGTQLAVQHLQATVEQVRYNSDTLAKLTIDENTLRQASVARMFGRSAQVQAVTAGWSPAILQAEEIAPSEWAKLIAWRAGCEFFLLDNYKLAERLFLRAKALGLDTPELHMALANVAKMQKDWSDACQRLRTMLDSEKSFGNAERAQAANLLAYCLYERARVAAEKDRAALIEEGLETTELATQLAGAEGYGKLAVQKALLLELQGQAGKARQSLLDGRRIAEAKLATYPRSTRLHFTLAIIAARLGEQDEALKQLAEAVRNETPDFPATHFARHEPAFAAHGLRESERFEKVLADRPHKDRDEFVPLTIFGLIWDEPFAASTPASRATDQPMSGADKPPTT